jgi:pimeloyl-ACP methyl ester carboxylesterase
MQSDSGFVEADGARIYYEVAGAGDELVLLHGFSLDRRMWDSQFEVFAARFRVIRVDLRGFGKSSVPDSDQPYSHAMDLFNVLKHVGVKKAHVCGLSLGSAVAVDFALMFPPMIRSLIVVDSVLDGFHWSEQQRSLDGAVWKLGREEGIEAARRAWLEHPLFAPLMKRPDAARQLKRIVGEYSGWHWNHRNPNRWIDPPAITQLGRINVPALAVVGERDLPDFLAVADVLASGIPGARKVILAGVGHMSPMEAPEEFNRRAIDFLEGILPTGTGSPHQPEE